MASCSRAFWKVSSSVASVVCGAIKTQYFTLSNDSSTKSAAGLARDTHVVCVAACFDGCSFERLAAKYPDGSTFGNPGSVFWRTNQTVNRALSTFVTVIWTESRERKNLHTKDKRFYDRINHKIVNKKSNKLHVLLPLNYLQLNLYRLTIFLHVSQLVFLVYSKVFFGEKSNLSQLCLSFLLYI